MQEIIFNLVLGAMAVAGLSAIWRNWLEDNQNWEKFIRKIFSFKESHKVLTCGPCFTYWAALAYTLILRPIGMWNPVQWNIEWLSFLANLFLQWMAFAWICVFLRFAYTELQQQVRKLS